MITNSHIKQKMFQLSEAGYPFSATFELTSRCNLFCKYCFVDRSAKELDTQEVKKVIDRLDQSGICTLLITGGELFIRTDILEILSHIFQKDFFEIYILSNGTMINREHIDFLAAHASKISFLRLSFFSHDPKIHDAFVGVPGAFEKTLNTVKNLLASGIRVGVIVNIIRENVKDIELTKEFFRSLGITIQIGKGKILANEDIKKEFKETISEEFYLNYYNSICEEKKVSLKTQLQSNMANNKGKIRLCEMLFSMVAIRSDGSFAPCLTFRNLSFGNIVTDQRSIQQIYTSSEIFQTLQKLKHSDIQKCRNCKYINVCDLCPGVMHSESGNFTEPPEMFCNMVKSLDQV